MKIKINAYGSIKPRSLAGFFVCGILGRFGYKTINLIRCAITGDIMAVSKEVGHANVTQTQRYADIPAEVVMEWFPSWKKIIMERLKLKESSNTFNVMLNDVKQVESGLEAHSVEAKEQPLLT